MSEVQLADRTRDILQKDAEAARGKMYDSASIDAMAQRVVAGDATLSKAASASPAVIAKVADIAKSRGWDGSVLVEYQNNLKTARLAQHKLKQISAGTLRYIDTVTRAAELVEDDLKKVAPNAKLKPASWLQAKLSELSNNPEFAGLITKEGFLSAEFARLRTGGALSIAQTHASAMEEANRSISSNMTGEQLLSAIRAIKSEGNAIMQSFKDVDSALSAYAEGDPGRFPTTDQVMDMVKKRAAFWAMAVTSRTKSTRLWELI